MGNAEDAILRALEEHGSLTLSELVKETGFSRSWTWKIVRRLQARGIVRVEKARGILRVTIARLDPDRLGILRIGILRAAEYPYVLRLARLLRERWPRVEVEVYEDPYMLQALLASGRVHLAMLPAVTTLLAHRITRGAVRIIGGGSGGGAGIIVNPRGWEAHATTMASSMEYCAVKTGLPGERIYAASGSEILDLVASGRASHGVVWEPYLSLARRRGLRVEECELESCCLLAANRWLEPHYDLIARLMAESVSWARERARSPAVAGALARLIGVPRELVADSVRSYVFYEEPPVDILERSLENIRATVLPVDSVRSAVYR